MSIQTRRERDAQKMKEDILAAAREISNQDGFASISIRKIAQKIEYTPSIIYHYFSNKEEILEQLLESGYLKLTTSLASSKRISDNPEDTLRIMTRTYIEEALKIPEEFAIVHSDSSPNVIKHTSFLFEGASEKRKAIHMIKKCIIDMNPQEELEGGKVELTAQSIAAATMGLTLKLIAEKNLEEAQKKKIIDYFSDEMVVRMAKYPGK
ncbi:TetR/AcrR family transcriptional regulator [Sphaerochaeta globosa]|uniref:Regulatory protein TetR n=1 Tax=Sphaerochaeta globosa (strain ATCC BAA-1886 / DSM 22777 / Buddy) TaxID=158189 RepID=F0RRK5_SPHGB|nr:TetR/AcrR family transcriptional regulator [Sphaerochaeta globosa]ADY14264.1 regulatory protein TetR [Sphaerochaeta globosa str. Buddy]